MKYVVSKEAIREFVKEALDNPNMSWQTTGDVSNVSAVVDPSAAVTNPSDKNFKPANRAELKTALSSIVNSVSDDDAAEFYLTMKSATEKPNSEDEKMKNKEDKKVEETVRRAVKKMLREFGPYKDTGLSYSGPMTGTAGVKAGFEECEACDGEGILDDGTDCKVCKGKGALPSGKKKNKMMTDVGGATFKEIAKELGYASESGVKQAIEKILEKAKTVFSMEPEELEILTLTAMNDYIEMLKKSGELSSSDVELMKTHPKIVAELDGFREFFSKVLKRATAEGQKVVNPLEDE